MTDTCLACGKPIHTRRAQGIGITLQQVWVHTGRRRRHRAIPTNHEYR